MFSDGFNRLPRHFIKEQDYEKDANHEEHERPPAQFGLAMK